MRETRDRRRDRQAATLRWVALCAVAAAGTVLRLLETSAYGPGTSPDAVNYLAAASNLANGNGFVSFTGAPISFWPPAFPALLAGLGFVGIDPPLAARLVNATAFGLLLLVAGSWMLATFRSRWIAAVAITLLLLAHPLAGVATFALSEPLFLLLVLLSLRVTARYLEDGGRRALLAAAVLAALALLTRQIGLTVVAAGGLLVLLYGPKPFLDRIRDGLWFGAVAVTPYALWLLRTWLVTGTLTGPRDPAVASFAETMREAARTLSGWVLPLEQTADPASAYIAAGLVATFAGSLVLLRVAADGDGRRRLLAQMLPHAMFTAVYTGLLIVIVLRVPVDQINDRLLSPVYTSFWFVLFLAWDVVLRTARRRRRRRQLTAATVAAAAVWLIWQPLGRAYIDFNERRAFGAGGYSTAAWDNELVDFLRARRLQGLVLSSNPYALFYLTGNVARRSPQKQVYRSTIAAAGTQIARLQEDLSRQKAGFLVWFDADSNANLVAVEELSKHIRVERLVNKPGGILYGISAPGYRATGIRIGRE